MAKRQPKTKRLTWPARLYVKQEPYDSGPGYYFTADPDYATLAEMEEEVVVACYELKDLRRVKLVASESKPEKAT